MGQEDSGQQDLMAAFWQGLSHPIRLRILDLLRQRETANVGEMVQALQIGQGHLSNHLSCLKSCGFVSTAARGRFVYYRIADARVNTLLDLGLEMLHDHAQGVAACVVVGPHTNPAGTSQREFLLPVTPMANADHEVRE